MLILVMINFLIKSKFISSFLPFFKPHFPNFVATMSELGLSNFFSNRANLADFFCEPELLEDILTC